MTIIDSLLAALQRRYPAIRFQLSTYLPEAIIFQGVVQGSTGKSHYNYSLTVYDHQLWLTPWQQGHYYAPVGYELADPQALPRLWADLDRILEPIA